MNDFISRRGFLHGSLSATAALALMKPLRADDAPPKSPYKICAFIKFIQSMSYDQLADAIAKMGYDGVEATVRGGGYILPERAPDELPGFVEALKARGLDIMIMTSDIRAVDQPHAEKLLRTAAALGVKKYRLGFYKYDLKKPIIPQLENIKPALADIAALNRELGISAVFQNHSGASHVGATLWDMRMLLEEIPPNEIGNVFDIRHATVEAGMAWPVLYDVMKPHITAISVKDFKWDGDRAVNVPLGEGRVDPDFFELVEASDFAGPITVHVEYLGDADEKENADALDHDLKTLRKWL